MEILQLSESTPRTESRLKSLFWPSVESAADVDYLGVQGFWVCTIVAFMTGIFMLITGQPLLGLAVAAFFFLSGVGVREHSKFAALIVFAFYLLDTVIIGFGVARILFLALLLSNLRATYVASQWKPESEEAVAPPRMSETWGDKLSDQLPQFLWPKIRLFYQIYSVGIFALEIVGLMALYRSRIPQ